MQTRLLCDFCCSRDDGDEVTWEYPCKTFDIQAAPGIGGTSHGSWAACVKCHRLIDDDKRDELIQRSVDKWIKNEGYVCGLPQDVVDILKGAIKKLHDEFFANRQGNCRLAK